MNLVVLSLCDPVDQFVIKTLEKQFSIRAIIRPVYGNTPKQRDVRKLLKKLRFAKVVDALRRQFYRHYLKQTYRETFESLFPNEAPEFRSEVIEIPSHEINSRGSAKLIQSLHPDILLVCGAPILKPSLFTIARTATINIHFGIAPQYRGIHTVFWPLYFNDPGNVGVTLHHIDAGMDTGHVLAHGRPEMKRQDTEGTLWASCARVAADAAFQILKSAESGADLSGQAQLRGGRKFFNRDRKIRHDISYRLLRFLGRRKLVSRPQRVDSFVLPQHVLDEIEPTASQAMSPTTA